MKTQQTLSGTLLAALAFFLLFGCAPVSRTADDRAEAPPAPEQTQALVEQAPPAQASKPLEQGQLPVRFQQPSYVLKESAEAAQAGLGKDEEIIIPVGADISSTTGPVPLRDILKRLAALKNMNVSWASDVDQHALVDVDIKAEDDFFQAIDNILRQLDYFSEVDGNTIVIKYRETRKFHIAMPFTATNYEMGVGGDFIGGKNKPSDDKVKGNIKLYSTENKFDIWENIRTNLDQILEIWEETVPAPAPDAGGTEASATGGQETAAAPPAATTRRNVQEAKGYYSIDKPIGLITVTAPRPLIKKVDRYVKNLKAELYKQISIEAKFVEVTLTEKSTAGIDWTGALSAKGLDFELFGDGTGGTVARTGLIYPGANRVISAVSLTNPFTLVLDAIKDQGKTKVLANPKVSVMNGQPAFMNIGESIDYINSIESKVEDGVITYTVKTASVMSGIGLTVLATILDDNEIVLCLTPITSNIEGDIEYKDFGGVNQVGLPRIKLRQMNTVVRVKDGELLVIGGLIDNTEKKDETKVPLLGDIPGLKNLFSSETVNNQRKELVILLQPKII